MTIEILKIEQDIELSKTTLDLLLEGEIKIGNVSKLTVKKSEGFNILSGEISLDKEFTVEEFDKYTPFIVSIEGTFNEETKEWDSYIVEAISLRKSPNINKNVGRLEIQRQ